tara:strand:+ start:1075 stop:1659 length:585 start_codon:yes stop_codon:yes gene_type:complete
MLKFSTSNKDKIEEIKNASNIPVIEGIDIEEIDSDSILNIILHKAKDMYLYTGEEGIIVEDSVLTIDNKVVGDIKFRMQQLEDNPDLFAGKDTTFTVSLGVVVEDYIYIFQGHLNGMLDLPQGEGFAFDPYFYPKNYDKKISLAELKDLGLKKEVSPRVMAIKKLENYFKNKKGSPDYKVSLKDIKKWKGTYQK